MSRVTRFAARDSGMAPRMAGFLAHLRGHGFRLGVGETGLAMAALAQVDAARPDEARLALQAVCAGSAGEVARFGDLFDAYWRNEGRVRPRAAAAPQAAGVPARSAHGATRVRQGPGRAEEPGGAGDQDDGAAASEATGRLVASKRRALMKTDLRALVTPEDMRRAERLARDLGQALRDRRSRRRRAARRGAALDLRRTIRQSLSTGGEPLRLARRHRPDRPVRIVALCDVSGSMAVYARPFLAFLSGLIRADDASDAWLFHTRLVHISGALRERDALRALARLTLMADGFGGGSRIGENLAAFARGPARRRVDGRSVVLILSDGYDSDPPERLGAALARLRRRGCRIVWLNPLKGWQGYAPVARGMAAALPHLDLFAPAGTLDDLAALQRDLGRL